MIRRLATLFLAIYGYFLLSASFLFSADQYVATSVDIENGKLFYTEEYQELFENGKPIGATVVYWDSTREKTVEKTIRFGQTDTQPAYHLINCHTGYLEGVKKDRGSYEVYCRRGFFEDIEEKTLKVPDPVVIDTGIHFFIQEHWQSLLSGQALTFYFIVPRQLDYYTMRIRQIEQSRGQAKNLILFEVEPNSFFIRMISQLIGIKPILMTYHPKTRRIMEYQGITGIPIGDSGQYQVRTKYQYLDF